jgi:hypothetical protein
MKALFQKKLNQKMETINPKALIEKDGQVGVLQQPSGGGAISFKGVEGIEVPKDSKSEKAAIDLAKAMTEKEMKELKHILTLFAKPGKQLFDPETLEITNEGKSALDAALDLINKEKDGKPLSRSESEKLPHAKTAWKIYGASVGRINASYGEPDNPSAGQPIDWRQYDR